MIQQVNLYQEILQQNQSRQVISPYILGLIVIILLLIGISVYIIVDLNNTKNNLQQAKLQLREAETRIQLIQAQYPVQQINTLLAQEITRTQNILASLSRVIHLLTDKKSDQTQGFSQYFSALARQSISDVWLTTIYINAQTNNFQLQGSTYIAEKIPVFIQKLHKESVFQGKHFEKLIMSQNKESENQIDFTVSSTTEPLERENHD
jgi:hypothetical protein